MSLADLANVPDPHDENSFNQFSFSNQDSHIRIVRAIQEKYNITLPVYILDPMPLFDMGAWNQTHQQMHNDMNGVTGVAGVDLTSVDWSDPEQAATEARLHWSEHQQNEDKLGITQ